MAEMPEKTYGKYHLPTGTETEEHLAGRENELLKFFFADFPAARTAFIFRPFGTAEIPGAVWYKGGFQRIPTMTAFDFSRARAKRLSMTLLTLPEQTAAISIRGGM